MQSVQRVGFAERPAGLLIDHARADMDEVAVGHFACGLEKPQSRVYIESRDLKPDWLWVPQAARRGMNDCVRPNRSNELAYLRGVAKIDLLLAHGQVRQQQVVRIADSNCDLVARVANERA